MLYICKQFIKQKQVNGLSTNSCQILNAFMNKIHKSVKTNIQFLMGNRQCFNYSQIELTTLIEQKTQHILDGSQLYRSSLNDYYLRYKQRIMPSQAFINFGTKYIKQPSKADCNQNDNDEISIVPVLHHEQKNNSHLCISQKQFVFILPYYNWTLDKYLACTAKSGKARTDQILYVLQQMLKILIKLEQESLRLALFRNGTKQIYLNLKGRPCIYLLAYQEDYQQHSEQNSMTRLSACLLESLTNHTINPKNKRYLPTLVDDKRVGQIFKTLLYPIQLQNAKQVLGQLMLVRKQYPLKMKALGRKRGTQTSIYPTPTKRKRNSFVFSSRIRHNQQSSRSPINISRTEAIENYQKQKMQKSNATTVRPDLNIHTFETEKKEREVLKTLADNQIPNKTLNLSVNDFNCKFYDTGKSFYQSRSKRTQQQQNLGKSSKKEEIWRKAVIPIQRSIVFQ